MMANLWVRVRNSHLGRRLLGTGLIARSLRSITGTFSLRLTSVGLRFLVSLVLARLLGARGFGVYNFAIAWVSLLAGPSIAGFERLVIRDLATYRRDAEYRRMNGLLRFSQRFTVISAVVIAVIGMGVAWTTYRLMGRPALLNARHADLADTAVLTLMIALFLVPVRALLLLQQAAMQGLHRVFTAQIPEQLVQPVLFLVGLGGLFVAGGAMRSAPWAMALVLLTTGIALILSVNLLKRTTPHEVRRAIPLFEARLWVLSAIPFALTRGLAQLNLEVDSIMLGVLSSAEGVALYTAAQPATQLIALVLLSAQISLSPTIAQLHAEGRHAELQRVLTQSARMVLAGALPLTLFFCFAGEWFLALFGDKFSDASTALILLSVGQFINAATGAVWAVLLMTGYERDAIRSVMIGTALHLALDVLLIPGWGVNGAAVAGGATVAFVNIYQMILVWRRLRLNTSAFRLRRRENPTP